jgi:transcriptional regulator with XRE-family HTH domain
MATVVVDLGDVTEEERARTFLRVLGDELRTARKKRGWTRAELIDRLGLELSQMTIGTWELGTRPCTALRVWQLCEVLEISIVDLYARVARRMAGPRHGVTIDLVATVDTRSSRLGPLQAWARTQRRADPDRSRPTALLAFAALERMAELCELPTVEFIERLHQAGLVRRDLQASPAPSDATAPDDSDIPDEGDTELV